MNDLPTYDHLTDQELIRLYQFHDSLLVRALLERLEIAHRTIEDLEK